jgi:hypothetical protein
LLTPENADIDPDRSIATFAVDKFFNDGNPAEVEATISCNTGLPLEQTAPIAQNDGVAFVVTDFSDGEMDCSIAETAGVDGYAVEYSYDGTTSQTGCTFEVVRFGQSSACRIDNELRQVLVEVTKWWMDENPSFSAVDYAEARFDCINEQFGIQAFGNLEFVGDGAVDGFFLFPQWDGSTSCDVNETVVENGVEFDDSECQDLIVTPGNGASCSLYNTRVYEGIPTLSRHGLGLLALLMLGLGLVAFRRVA